MGTVLRKFKSRLNYIPIECRMALFEIPYQIKLNASLRKKYAYELLKSFNVNFQEIGTGTNRYIIKIDDYAVKIALDTEGVADNKQEWVMSHHLNNVSKSYECTHNGNILVAHYCPAFSSKQEFRQHSTEIKKILNGWSSSFLLGDVGLEDINYANWGLLNGKPVCIDYAYIFPADLKLFKCVCGCTELEVNKKTFASYKCVNCGYSVTDREAAFQARAPGVHARAP